MNIIQNSIKGLETAALQNIPRSMVHRSAISEVFLTDGIAIDKDRFLCVAQIPRSHLYYNDHIGSSERCDLLLVMEIYRQVSIFAAHRFLNVPSDAKFLYGESVTRLDDYMLDHLSGEQPTTVMVDARVTDKSYKRNDLQGVTFDMTLKVGNNVIARHENMVIRWMSPAIWMRIRTKPMDKAGRSVYDHAQVKPLPPRSVGRQCAINVVVGEELRSTSSVFESRLHIPFSNASIFDHALDHIPGMLLVEFARQTALLAAENIHSLGSDNLYLQDCKVSFMQFGEFNCETLCVIQKQKIHCVDSSCHFEKIEIVQQNRSIALAALKFSSNKLNSTQLAAALDTEFPA